MAVAFVQKATLLNHQNSSATSGSPGALTNTAGNALICIVPNFTSGGQSVSSITDTQSNTWNRVSTAQVSGSNTLEVWAALGIKAGSNTVTVNFAAAAFFSIALYEFSGVVTVAPAADVAAVSSSTTGTAHSSGSTASALAGDLVIGGGYDGTTGDGGTYSVSDGKTQLDNDTSSANFITSWGTAVAGVQSIAYSTSSSTTGGVLVGCWTLLAAAGGGAPFFIAFPRIKGLELDNPLSPVVGLQSTFLQPQVLPPIPVAAPATVPATVLVAVQKRAVRLRRPSIIVAPQTPTFTATQLVGRQKRPVKRPPPQLRVAPQTPTFAPTVQRAIQKRPVRAPRPQRLVPAPQTPTFPAIVVRGIKRSIPLLRVRPLVRVVFVPPPPPTFPATILRGIRRLVRRQLRPSVTIGGQPKLPPPVGQASSPVGTPTQPTVGQQAPGPVGTPTQPGTGQSTPSVVGTPTQKQP